jgi:glycosylphosphatidylinositol deacylase
VDLNEDFSALHGNILRDQAAYIAFCVKEVLARYKHPRQLTIIGHSMGGIAARLALTMGIESSIDAVITMSTPHLLAPVTTDLHMANVYKEIAGYSQPLLISICGGSADTQIASDACAIKLDPAKGFAVFTTSMPGVWTGVDHQAMVWCHQVRWRVARALLDMTRGSSPTDKLRYAERWLVPGLGMEESHTIRGVTRNIEANGTTTIILDQEPGDIRCCEGATCERLHHELEVIPSPRDNVPFPLPGEGIKPDEIRYALSATCVGSLRLEVEPDADLGAGDHVYAVVKENKWKTDLRPTRITLLYPHLSASSLKAYIVRVVVETCNAQRPLFRHTSIGHSSVYEHRYFRSDSPKILLHSHTGPAPFISAGDPGLRVDIYQWPECPVVEVKVESDVWRSYSKAITRLRMGIIAWSVGWSAILAQSQLRESQLRDLGGC